MCAKQVAAPPRSDTVAKQADISRPPKEPPAEEEMEVEDVRLDLDFDASHSWYQSQRVVIRAMDDSLAKVREEILVEVGDLEAYLLGPTDVLRVSLRSWSRMRVTQKKEIWWQEAVCGHASKNGIGLPRAPSDHQAHEHEAESAVKSR